MNTTDLRRGRGAAYDASMQVKATSAKASPIISVVACPDCKSPVDAPCVSAHGTKQAVSHRSRVRMANRIKNQA